MNRRNVLVGLGTIVAGGGAALGTGAFSSVEAERSVSVSTSGDSSANVQLSVDASSNAIGTSGGDTIDIQGQNLNLKGITTVEGVLTITVGSSAGGTSYSIDIYDDTATSTSITRASAATGSSADDIQLVANDTQSTGTNDGAGGFTGLSPGDSVVYDLVFNLRDDTSTGSASVPWTNGTMVVEALDNS
jgi:hypothetical protein